MSDNQKDNIVPNEADLVFEKKQISNFLKTLIRRKTIIIFLSIIGIFTSSIFALSKKRVWKGDFQIVLEKKNNASPLSAIDPIFARLALPGSGSSQLQTEVEILKSPYVLVNAYEFVKSKSKGKLEELRFQDWLKKLDIKLLRGTKILNIDYQDTNKDMILDVLNQISISYQNYSKLSENRDFELGTKFYEEQIKLHKIKASNYLKEIQDYASLHDLNFGLENSGASMLNIDPRNFISGNNLSTISSPSPSVDTLNIEVISAKATNNIKLINKFIYQLENIEDNDDSILYLAMKILPRDKSVFADSSNYISIIDELREAKIQISLKKTIFQENDKIIKVLLKNKNRLLKLLKDQTLGFLYSEKQYEENKLQMASRSNEVLVKYKELKNDSLRNKKILNDLEQGYKILSLEKAKYEDPWKMITEPNLLPYPVGPKRKQIVLIGSFLAFLASIIIIIIDEKRKGIIFYLEQITKLVNWDCIALLDSKDKDYKEKLDIFSKTIIKNINKETIFLYAEEDENNLLIKFKNEINKLTKDHKFIFTNNVLKAQKTNQVIILITLQNTTIKNIEVLKNKLKILNETKGKYLAIV